MIVKKILLALVCSIVIDTAFDAFLKILVMVPVDAGFSGGYKPIYSIWSTLVLHVTFRFRLSQNIDELGNSVVHNNMTITYVIDKI